MPIQLTACPLPLRDLQARFPPDALDPCVIDLPPSVLSSVVIRFYP